MRRCLHCSKPLPHPLRAFCSLECLRAEECLLLSLAAAKLPRAELDRRHLAAEPQLPTEEEELA